METPQHSQSSILPRTETRRLAKLERAFAMVAFLASTGFFMWERAALQSATSDDSWPYYGHDVGGMRYSQRTQINRSNVAALTATLNPLESTLTKNRGRGYLD